MKRFTELIQQLETSNKTNDKIAALVSYFSTADEKDKPYVIAMFTGKKPKRPVNTALIREWATELSDIPAWLFAESYHSVGDLSETIALVLPPPAHTSDRNCMNGSQIWRRSTGRMMPQRKSSFFGHGTTWIHRSALFF